MLRMLQLQVVAVLQLTTGVAMIAWLLRQVYKLAVLAGVQI